MVRTHRQYLNGVIIREDRIRGDGTFISSWRRWPDGGYNYYRYNNKGIKIRKDVCNAAGVILSSHEYPAAKKLRQGDY